MDLFVAGFVSNHGDDRIRDHGVPPELYFLKPDVRTADSRAYFKANEMMTGFSKLPAVNFRTAALNIIRKPV